MIQFTHETIGGLSAATSREWLETNGLGGFSSSTIIGLNTRRYHGLLTAATTPPVGRVVMLSKLEETLIVDGRRYELSANQYPGTVHPQGFQFQTGFRLDPFPIFTYEVEGLRLEKTVFMVHGENTTVVCYELGPNDVTARSIELELRPLIAFRDYHSTTHENAGLDRHVELEDGQLSIKPYTDMPALYLAHDTAEVNTEGYWYRNFEYSVERERGLDSTEDLFSPLLLKFDLTANRSARIIASTQRHNIQNADEFRTVEIEQRKAIDAEAPIQNVENHLVRSLTSAAAQFISARASGKTIIAGYHWFSDWGRDTMIALPGLTLATGHSEIAKSILVEFAKHVDQGMLPNRFPDAGETPEYNTVDATLWFFEAVRALAQDTNDLEFIRRELYDVLADIIAWHLKGTRYNIHVHDDGLLAAGEPGVQLTWMDAKVGEWVVTPREGKPVEIQALWYNALRVMENFARQLKLSDDCKQYKALAARTEDSFNKLFWNEEDGCLYDVVNDGECDVSIRPNQILAISLGHSMVQQGRAESILRVVERELLTTHGLRTLAPQDPRYIGRYEGDPQSRDGAYHQGTVWPWLMGPYITAYVKTFGENLGRKFATEWLKNFSDHLAEGCLGQVSEIFDGDSPHAPRGCVAQAWSVAELLRVAVEVVYASKTAGQSGGIS